MQKLYNTLTLQNVLPRPAGFIRYWLFLLCFLISRIPLWFVAFSAVIYISSINIIQGLFIAFAILLCRTFVESEMAGGKNAFTFFAVFRLLRAAYGIILYFFILGVIIYLIYPENNDIFGKVTVLLALLLLPVVFKSRSYIIYHHGYYVSKPLSCIITFLWFYLGFIPDTLFINITLIVLIYILEFYNLIYKKPLGILPNQTSLKQ